MKQNGGSGREDGSGAYTKASTTPAAHLGAVYAVAGSSGQTSGGTLNHPAMFISLNQLGSMVLDVDGNRLDAKFLRETGAIADYFTMLKTTPGGPPPAPTGLVATPGNGQVSLAWNAAAGAATYNVKRSTTSGGPYTVRATGLTQRSYTDTGLTNGTTYHYVVSGVSSGGQEGANSAQASATPAASTGPTTFVARGATWKYLDNGTNQGTAWRATSFNDSDLGQRPGRAGLRRRRRGHRRQLRPVQQQQVHHHLLPPDLHRVRRRHVHRPVDDHPPGRRGGHLHQRHRGRPQQHAHGHHHLHDAPRTAPAARPRSSPTPPRPRCWSTAPTSSPSRSTRAAPTSSDISFNMDLIGNR